MNILWLASIVAVAGSSCVIHHNSDLAGHDIGAVHGRPFEACCDICKQNPACKAYAWNQHLGGTCWLKGRADGRVWKQGVKFGVVTGIGCQLHSHTDIEGGDIKAFHRSQYSRCCTLCQQTVGCRGFSWNNYRGGTCWLKNQASRRIHKHGVFSGVVESATNVEENRREGGSLATFAQFQSAVTACGFPTPTRDQYTNAVGQAASAASITTKLEFAMFLAQIIWESGGLVHKEEIACKVTKCPNDYRTPGCDMPGKFYYGRGYIQLSWCYNYRAASKALYGDSRLVRDPDQVTTDSTAWATAFWFWKENVHNKPGVQAGKFGVTTNAINGFHECQGSYKEKAEKRFEVYKKVFKALEVSGRPDERGCYN